MIQARENKMKNKILNLIRSIFVLGLIFSGSVNATITYSATDKAGNSANIDRVVTVVGPKFVSLTLESNATILNVGEKAALTVMGTYEDNSSKVLTSNIEWIVTPSNSVQIDDNILTALKDTQVTLQAKVGNTLSNTLNLTIIWEVNGHRLPPEPDSTLNNSTLLGIDTNDNGVRDDVERWIYDRYKDDHPIMIPLKMQAARAYQKIIVDPSKAKDTYYIVDEQMNCQDSFGSWANAFGRKPLFEKDSELDIKEMREMKDVIYNTTQRARAYGLYNQTLSGMVFRDEWPSQKWIDNCDFNMTKYIEMSEKVQ